MSAYLMILLIILGLLSFLVPRVISRSVSTILYEMYVNSIFGFSIGARFRIFGRRVMHLLRRIGRDIRLLSYIDIRLLSICIPTNRSTTSTFS